MALVAVAGLTVAGCGLDVGPFASDDEGDDATAGQAGNDPTATDDDGDDPAAGGGSATEDKAGDAEGDAEPPDVMTGTSGTVDLAAGFLPDPYAHDVTGGGSEPAASFADAGCAGYIAPEPDFVVDWSGDTAQLRVLFTAERAGTDASLAVLGPDGVWTCGDDSDGLPDPLVLVDRPAVGPYGVWVGTPEPGGSIEGRLFVTELELSASAFQVEARPQPGFGTGSFGSVALEAGFSPDPYTVEVVSGGDQFAPAYAGPECAGFVAVEPDFVVDWSGTTAQLRMAFAADLAGEDATLAVLAPDGVWTCGDDTEGSRDPAITIAEPASGEYAIWVGSFLPGVTIPGQLLLTEQELSLDDMRGADAEPPGDGPPDYASGTFGGVALTAGFTPDPHITEDVLSGGAESAAALASADCVGFVAVEPDYIVEWSGTAAQLRIFFVADLFDGDTTLAVLGPDGRWTCGDDSELLFDPVITIPDPLAGQYAIWVGSYYEDETLTGDLYVTEQDLRPEDFPPSF